MGITFFFQRAPIHLYIEMIISSSSVLQNDVFTL